MAAIDKQKFFENYEKVLNTLTVDECEDLGYIAIEKLERLHGHLNINDYLYEGLCVGYVFGMKRNENK